MQKVNHYLKATALLCVLCVLGACVYIPKIAKKPQEPSCELVTQQLVLGVEETTSRVFWEEGFGVIDCTDDFCWIQLSLIAAVPIGTAIVSGSIVLIGNAVHWLEKQGRCEKNLSQ